MSTMLFLPSGVGILQLAEHFILLHEVGLDEGGVGEEGVLSKVEGDAESLRSLQLGIADVLQVGQGLLIILKDGRRNEVVVLENTEPELGNTLDLCESVRIFFIKKLCAKSTLKNKKKRCH